VHLNNTLIYINNLKFQFYNITMSQTQWYASHYSAVVMASVLCLK